MERTLAPATAIPLSEVQKLPRMDTPANAMARAHFHEILDEELDLLLYQGVWATVAPIGIIEDGVLQLDTIIMAVTNKKKRRVAVRKTVDERPKAG